MSASGKPRRWTVLGSGLLCGVLALVVLFTDRHAFFSPRAVIVVAAIGLAAVLLQLRLRNRDVRNAVHPPVIGLNILGIACALVALFSDVFQLRADTVQLLAFGAVGSFAVSSAIILHSFRKPRALSK
jgi:uncharacterized membrane protein